MKVAVCFSGQTRVFDLVKDDILNDIHRLFEGHSVDFFGHTWNDCPVPVDLSIFKEFKQTDQNEISEWVKKDITTFGTFCEWDDIPEYQDVLNGNKNFLDFVCERSKGRLGQTVSAHKAFKLVPTDEYDLIVRYRWDNHLYIENYIYGPDRAIADFKSSLDEFMNSGIDIAVPIGLRFCAGHIGKITPPDLFFVMTPYRHKRIVNRSIKRIHESINSTDLSSHSLWGEVLCHYVDETKRQMGKVVSMLPNLWQPYGKQSFSENKKWKL